MPRAVAVLFAVVAVAVCACGDGEDDEFRDSFAPVHQRLDSLGGDVADALLEADAKSRAALEAEFTGFARELAALRADVRRLDAPQGMRADVDKLDLAMARVEAALAEIAAAGGEGDLEAGRLASRTLVRWADRMDSRAIELAGGPAEAPVSP